MISIRKALADDVAAMHAIRLAVRENRLSDPSRITLDAYRPYIAAGTAWVGEDDGQILGFAAIDAADRSVWALFVSPDRENGGVGRALHEAMLRWAGTHELAWLELTTGADTRAQGFYRHMGWEQVGTASDGQRRFRWTRDRPGD